MLSGQTDSIWLFMGMTIFLRKLHCHLTLRAFTFPSLLCIEEIWSVSTIILHFSDTNALLAHAKPQFFIPKPLPQFIIVPKHKCIMYITSEMALSWNSYTFHHPPFSHLMSALIASIKTALRKKHQLDLRYLTRFKSFCFLPHNVRGRK